MTSTRNAAAGAEGSMSSGSVYHLAGKLERKQILMSTAIVHVKGIIPKIANELPSFSIEMSQLAISDNLKLADPIFCTPGKIDALIGGEYFLRLLQNGKIELGENLPTLKNSKLGWIIGGSIPSHLVASRSTNLQYASNAYTCLLTNSESVNDELSRFWDIEEYQTNNNTRLSGKEQACENYFIKTEYIDLNHMSETIGTSNERVSVYLPHHGVIRESSTTTKLRVVFDGSAKTTSGISLNDTLMIGATLQDNIIDIILRFRLHAVAITADLCKMYRQILIHEDDRTFQKILWRFSPNEPIKEFELNTVTNGLACAPFLAIRCVRYLASDADEDVGQASKVLLNDLYVDNILTGIARKFGMNSRMLIKLKIQRLQSIWAWLRH
ncbi:uncharacterized protein LOC120356891 [Solenopsis invicta]|uniref:uncharacterized protein LOC120356891 n=1 Tax=Solenopsis invicta TaxID=13686 RepID=UPI00193EB2BF|nr:uncharacterized protein LOC120356891 [Solenopsis invicta]